MRQARRSPRRGVFVSWKFLRSRLGAVARDLEVDQPVLRPERVEVAGVVERKVQLLVLQEVAARVLEREPGPAGALVLAEQHVRVLLTGRRDVDGPAAVDNAVAEL